MDAEQIEEFKQRYRKALEIVEMALELSTGHDDYQRRKIAYYAVCTHWIKEFDPFPGFVLFGSPGTGKTMTLIILKATCYKVISITGKTITEAALKACMNESVEGTIIIEEADDVTDRDLEDILITRYSRSSADNKKMVPDGHKGWELKDYATFGATVAHRRNLFRDSALLRRVITVQTKRTKKAEFIQVTPKSHSALFKVFHDQLKWHTHLPEVSNKWDIEQAIFDAYRPIVALATFIDDKPFLEKLIQEMKVASDQLQNEEHFLDPEMLLTAVVKVVSKKVADKEITPELVNIEINRIGPALREEFDANCSVFKLNAAQRNRMLRQQGFLVKSSGGRQRLWFTLPQLIKVCEDYKLEDEIFKVWKSKLSMKDSLERKDDQTEPPKDHDPSVWDTEDE